MLMALVLATAGGPDDAAYRAEIDSWRLSREARLKADDGWLTLAGLFWLKPGANRFGADGANDIVLPVHESRPRPPSQAGTFTLDKGTVTVEVAHGVIATLNGNPVTRVGLRSDADADAHARGGGPDILALGSLTFQVIARQGRLAVRLKDGQSAARQKWHGLRYYPTKPSLRVIARFIPHPKPVAITVPNVLGYSESLPSPGTAVFEIDGRQMRLDPVIESPGDQQLFFIFRDRTAGKTTYASGRFLYADPPRDGHVVLDFNKAYNPPCAFTAYATCPLPPDQNRLSIPIEAGELLYEHHSPK
jgi:uncharacterized protein (DUF1684 family)